METYRTAADQGPAISDWTQKFWAAAAVVVLLLLLGWVDRTEAATRCEATASQLESAADEQALRIDRAGMTGGHVKAGIHQSDSRAFNEMLLGGHATALRWDRVPELVVLTSVMQYEKGRGTQYRATAQQLTGEEADALVADLTEALAVLTDDVFQGFAAVRRESAVSGQVVNVMRPGQIVVARYTGVRDQLATIGFGGRSTRNDLIRAGSIILDSDFDRTSTSRRLLRAHELGHALGYNHVQSRASIMNPQIGSEPNDFDRAVARVAFQNFAAPTSSCS